MPAPHLNTTKPGPRRRSTGRENFALPTITQGKGALSHESYSIPATLNNLEPPRSGAAPPSKRHDPAAVVSFPTTLTPEQRWQQAVWRRHARALTAFLEAPSAASEARVRGTGNRWIAAFLGEGVDAEQAHRSMDERLLKVRYQMLVTGLHALGPRPTGELLLEVIGGDERLRDDVFALLERYTRLTPEEVRAVGGDVFPPAPLHVAAE